MLDILDVDALRVEAQAKARRWQVEFEAQFNQPLVVAALVRDVLALPPAVRKQAEQDPRLGPALKQVRERARALRPTGEEDFYAAG